ncbi:extracellular solute-binding protein [Tessaracoccus sp. OS52]|uniref:ABC transporter substrate-binding protein n=1 Tax=Tessaracoccus sp. OS52 TaxID=2886691 RepID=UPI001D12C5CD|nr:extracellular solute-binding protein [Tessaracoccus sp. OS52]MCC2591884.1 extracellular solute-binding protein [Tessaracoccus sp. OS52]
MSVNISRRKLLFATGGVAASAVLVACSGNSGSSGEKGAVTWSTWGSPDELKGFDRFQEAFKTNNPDIELKFQPVPSYGDYHSKLQTQLTSNTAPDVFYVGDDRIASIIRNDVLLPIGEGLADTDLSQDDFAENILDIARWEGEVYALPNDVNPDTLWYDKEALAAAGITDDPAELAENDEWTTEAFLDMSTKLAAAGLTGAVFWNYWATHASWMTSQDGQVYDADGKYVAHTDSNSVAAMEEFAARFQAGEFKLADLLPTGAGSESMLVTHKLGFLAAGRYTIGAIRGAGVDETLYDVVRWPSPDGKARPTGVAASYLAINKNAADPEAALKFFSSFLDAEGQRLRLEDAGNAVPSVKGADDIVLDAGYPAHAQTMLDMRDLGYSNFPTEAAVPDLSNTISVEYMQPLYEGKSTAQETLDAVAALVEEQTA